MTRQSKYFRSDVSVVLDLCRYRQGDQEGDVNEFRNFFVSVESGQELTEWLNDIRTNKALLLGLEPSMLGSSSTFSFVRPFNQHTSQNEMSMASPACDVDLCRHRQRRGNHR